jgi:hypothetical protein
MADGGKKAKDKADKQKKSDPKKPAAKDAKKK